MHFFNGFSLLWALPIFTAIILLWKLKLNRKPLTVASLRLWQNLIDDKQADTPFHKLRKSLLLFMQLLASFLLILALAGPFVIGKAPAPRTVVFVIDSSASMNATDMPGTRLEAAKAACRSDIENYLRPYDSGALLCVNRDAIVVVPFTNRKELLDSGLDRIKATDESCGISAALTLASAILAGHGGPQIRLYSDGVYTDDEMRKLSQLDVFPASITNVKIGSPGARNAGITSVDARTNPITGTTELSVSIAQYGDAIRRESTVSVTVDGTLVAVRPLPGTATDQEVFTSSLFDQGKTATVTLDHVNDDLPDDNQATVPLPRDTPLKVLLVSTGNVFLERGLAVDKTIAVSEVDPASYLAHESQLHGYSVTVFDSFLPSGHVPPGRYIVFDAQGPDFPILFTNDIINNPQWVDENSQHPVMRYVSMDGTLIAQSPRTELMPWGESLAEADCGTLIAASEHNDVRCVDVAWSLSDSNWPLRVSFPIFLNNAVRWLAANRGENGALLQVQAGDPIEFDLPAASSNLFIGRPDGLSSVLQAPVSGGTVTYRDTDIAGAYTATATNFRAVAYVNLLDDSATDIVPRDLPSIKEGTGTLSTESPVTVNKSLAAWVAAAGLLVILLEWVVYHRRR